MFNPSSTETFGNVTLEAMASRLPVVAARATGSLSLVTEGVNGLLTTPDDIEESAAALAAYLSSPDGRRAAGEAGMRIAERFDWDRIRSEEHTSELQSLMRISYAVFCLKKKKKVHNHQ